MEKSDLDDLIGRSGVGSVCTGCHLLLQEMVGETVWTPVEVTAIEEVSNDARTYRFESKGESFHPAKAGQHIIMQAYIDGVWELRRYTLTTPAEETTYREITVQKEPLGKVSSWLDRISVAEKLIRVSQPTGDVIPDLVSARPLICLVGGIGVTPAISFIRSLHKKSGSSRQLILDHSVLNEDRLVLKDELQKRAEQNDNIHVNFRLTDSEGFIDQDNINELITKFPDSEFYVCGPPGYSDAVIGYLERGGVNQGLIYIELFFCT